MEHNASNSTVTDRRGKPRIKCAYPAIVHGCSIDGKKFEENATAINLSASGAYILVYRYLQNGQDLSVKIALPTGSLERGTNKLATTGIVVRTEFLEGVMGVAIKFAQYRFI